MTILIAARNAAATIERAVRSAAADPVVSIIVIDDHSTDDTVLCARRAGGAHLRVISAPDPGGVAVARQAGLDAVDTEFAAWLDADDEWVAGREARLSSRLADGFDVAIDAIDLYDGPSGAPLRQLTAPSFLRVPGGAVRLFERNFLPGDTQVAFRVPVFREAGGYDPAIAGPESLDILLRAIRRGATFTFDDEVGYRMYAYPGSLSRDIARQSTAIAAALAKHDYADVRDLYRRSGHSDRVTNWALVSLALFRKDPASALEFLEAASPATADPADVLEPAGPWPFSEGWRRAFQRGTIFLMMGGLDVEAEAALRDAERIEGTAEGANNLGVALARMGRRREADDQFALAESRVDGYYDARVNATSRWPARITGHPLRRIASRNDYAATTAA
jgi:glycosyltransferase involved in cell wall biosynthesis